MYDDVTYIGFNNKIECTICGINADLIKCELERRGDNTEMKVLCRKCMQRIEGDVQTRAERKELEDDIEVILKSFYNEPPKDLVKQLASFYEPEEPIISDEFSESIFELAFGDGAYLKGYTEKDVVKRLTEIVCRRVNSKTLTLYKEDTCNDTTWRDILDQLGLDLNVTEVDIRTSNITVQRSE